MLKQLSKYTTDKISHQVVGADTFSVQIASKIFSVQIVLQNDAEAAAGLNHPPPQSKAAASRPRHNWRQLSLLSKHSEKIFLDLVNIFVNNHQDIINLLIP